MGGTVITVEEAGAKALKEAMESVDTVLLIPPASKVSSRCSSHRIRKLNALWQNKFDLVRKYLQAAKAAKTVQNVVLLSSVGCDYAERDKQPRLRELIDLETLTMALKSDPSTGDTAHSPVIIRFVVARRFSRTLVLISLPAELASTLRTSSSVHSLASTSSELTTFSRRLEAEPRRRQAASPDRQEPQVRPRASLPLTLLAPAYH